MAAAQNKTMALTIQGDLKIKFSTKEIKKYKELHDLIVTMLPS